MLDVFIGKTLASGTLRETDAGAEGVVGGVGGCVEDRDGVFAFNADGHCRGGFVRLLEVTFLREFELKRLSYGGSRRESFGERCCRGLRAVVLVVGWAARAG